MAKYYLKDHGYPFKKIYKGKDWIGRVCKRGDGAGHLGIIGKLTVLAQTENEAFDQVVAQHLGYKSAAHLRAHNREVHRNNKAKVQGVRTAIIGGDFKALERLLLKGD